MFYRVEASHRVEVFVTVEASDHVYEAAEGAKTVVSSWYRVGVGGEQPPVRSGVVSFDEIRWTSSAPPSYRENDIVRNSGSHKDYVYDVYFWVRVFYLVEYFV